MCPVAGRELAGETVARNLDESVPGGGLWWKWGAKPEGWAKKDEVGGEVVGATGCLIISVCGGHEKIGTSQRQEAFQKEL